MKIQQAFSTVRFIFLNIFTAKSLLLFQNNIKQISLNNFNIFLQLLFQNYFLFFQKYYHFLNFVLAPSAQSEITRKIFKNVDNAIFFQNISVFMIEDYAKVFPVDEILNKRSGCYVRNAYAFGLHQKLALVPLKHIDYQLEVVNSLLSVTLVQKYQNPTDKMLEVGYSFPIDPKASVYKFVAQFGEVTIQGMVKAKDQAIKEYQEARKEGKQVAMGSLQENSKDIMNLEIGNIPPKTELHITISFLQQMDLSMNTFYKLIIPSTISPRYADIAEPIHKKITPNQNYSGQPSYNWSFKIQVKASRKIVFFRSPTHNVIVLNQNQQGTEVTLVMPETQSPNRDFHFFYTTEDFELPSSVVGKTDTSATIMLSFIPKFCKLSIPDAYRAEIQNQQFQTEMGSARGDYVFLLDRSKSMNGVRMDSAKQALILFLRSLPEDCYFNIISFGNRHEKMFNTSVRYNQNNIRKAINSVEVMSANFGGTNIFNPLEQSLNEKLIKGYPKNIFLLTDGAVSNTERVIKLVRNNSIFSRVHCIGIGNGASFDLVKGCSEAGKGKFIMIPDMSNPSEQIIALLESTLTPIISEINLSYNEEFVQSVVPNPKNLPYILKDEVVNFYVTYRKPLTEAVQFQLSYVDSVTKMNHSSKLNVPLNAQNHPFVDKMAHLRVIRSLELSAEEGVSLDDQVLFVKVKDLNKEAIKYSVQHQVLSKFTSFLCIGGPLSDCKLQQFNQIKQIENVQVRQILPQQYFRPPTSGKHRRKRQTKQIKPTKMEYILQKNHSQESYSDFKSTMAVKSYKNVKHSIKPASNVIKKVNKLESSNLDSYVKLDRSCLNPEKNNRLQSCSNLIRKDNIKAFLNQSEYIAKETYKSKSKANLQKYYERKEIGKVQNKIHKRQYASKAVRVTESALPGLKTKKQKQIVQSIEIIVNLQNPNGSWSNPEIFENLGVSEEWIQILLKQFPQDVVLTQLVVLWMERHYPEKKYALIIKKAISWLNQMLDDFRNDEKECLRKNIQTVVTLF